MNSIATGAPSKPSTAWLQTMTRYGRPAVVPALYSLYLLPFMRIIQPRTDEGSFLVGAARIVHGEVFARDFFEVMGPGSFYWLAAFFHTFGVTFFAARLCTFISSFLLAILLYVLAEPIKGIYRHLPFLIFFATYFGSVWPAISQHTDSDCLSLLAVCCIALSLTSKRRSLLVVSGAFCALAASTVQPKGFLLFVAILLFLIEMIRRRHTTWRSAVLFASGFALVLLVVLGYFYAHGALGALYSANFLWPLHHYSAVNDVPYGYGTLKFYWLGGAAKGSFAAVGLVLACLMIVPFFYIFLLPVLVPAQIVVAKLKEFPPCLLLYIGAGTAIWLSELHRKDITHLVIGSPVLIVLSVMLMSASSSHLARIGRIILITTACCVITCNFVLALTAQSVPTRVGRVAMLEKSGEIQELISHTNAGQEIFVYPYCPSFYFLSATVNPMPYSFLMPGYHAPAEFSDVLSVLKQRKPRIALWDTNFISKEIPVVFPAAAHLPNDQAGIESYLIANYNIVYERDGFRIMKRKDGPGD